MSALPDVKSAVSDDHLPWLLVLVPSMEIDWIHDLGDTQRFVAMFTDAQSSYAVFGECGGFGGRYPGGSHRAFGDGPGDIAMAT